MNRYTCLDDARQAVSGRDHDYDGAEDSFATVAAFWNSYLEHDPELTSTDVAILLGLAATARLCVNPHDGESWVNLARYAAYGAEVATEAPPPPDDSW